jgi:hypothetical protein
LWTAAELDHQGAHWNPVFVTLTLELSDLRTANEEVLAQLGGSSENQFDVQIAEIESFLMSIYRIAVLAVRSEHQIERAAEIWRETLDVIDSAAKKIQTVTGGRGDHPAIDRILEIRSAASDMLELYA